MANNHNIQIQKCGNCGKVGHIYRECNKPITSYGIICFRRVSYPSDIKSIPEIILIRRKFTIGYMEFIRGKYEIFNEEYILKIFEMMTINEKNNIKNIRNYDILRQNLGSDRDTPSYHREYFDGKKKFEILLSNNKLDELINKSLEKSTNWNEPEWGLPKGRRCAGENDIDCAIREFIEESGVSNVRVFENIIPLEEIYTGINNIKYKHIYFLAEYIENTECKTKLSINPEIPDQYNEISNLRWTSEKKCKYIIRPYYTSKISIINKAFQIIKYLNIYFE